MNFPGMDQAAALAIRALAAAPLTLPINVAGGVARAAARAFATSRINRKKFPRATSNLADAFPGMPEERIRELAIGAYEHLFQLGIEVLYAPRLITEDAFQRHLDIRALSSAAQVMIEGGPCILISGHVGNWELIGYSVSMLGFPMHAVYRPLDLKPLGSFTGAITVDRRGRSQHDAADTRAARRLEHVESAADVDRLGQLGLGDRPWDRGQRSLVEDMIDAFTAGEAGRELADVSLVKREASSGIARALGLGRAQQRLEVVGRAGVEVVDPDHALTEPEQVLGQVRADEARDAGDQPGPRLGPQLALERLDRAHSTRSPRTRS